MTDIFSHIEVADGRVWLKRDGVPSFAGDLPIEEQKLIWATQGAPTADLFKQKVEGTAWKSKPSWYIVATRDHTIQPDLERFVAKRMGAESLRNGQQPRSDAVPAGIRARRDPKSRKSARREDEDDSVM